MKFHNSDFYDYKGRPYSWCDFGLDEEKTIEKYVQLILKVYDADFAGNTIVDFVFENGKIFRLHYGWWIENSEYSDDYDADSDEYISDEYFIENITFEASNLTMRTYRDILPKYTFDSKLDPYVC